MLLCRPCSELLIASVKAMFAGTKSVMSLAHWRASTAVLFVPFTGSCSPPSTPCSAVALIAVSAVVRLPGGVRVPLMRLMKRFCHSVLLTTVMLLLLLLELVSTRVRRCEGKRTPGSGL